MLSPNINTDITNVFFEQFCKEADPNVHVVMVWDRAGFHTSKDLKVPDNVTIVPLPPYSPELNPTEQIWNMLRRDYFANRVFDSLAAAIKQAEKGLATMAADKIAMKSLSNWPWINAILNTI